MRRAIAFAVATLVLIGTPVVVAEASGDMWPAKTIVLSGDAVGPVRFGEAQSEAAASLVKLIGASAGGVRKDDEGDCTVSAALYWTNFAVFFYHGTFDGYQTGNYLNNKSAPTFNGVTPQGLRVGFTLARAKRLYGSEFSTSGVQGGVYAVATKTGTIRGYLSVEPNQEPATNVKLMSISAGSVGCPAMSPG